MMTVLSPVSPDDDSAAVLAGLVGDGSLGESPINATDDVAGNGAEGTTQFKASTHFSHVSRRRATSTCLRCYYSSERPGHQHLVLLLLLLLYLPIAKGAIFTVGWRFLTLWELLKTHA